MDFLKISLPFVLLLGLLTGCAPKSTQDPWAVSKVHHDQGTSCIKVHTSRFPHRGFDVVWQKNGSDEWILLETSSFLFEDLGMVEVVITSKNHLEFFTGTVRKGGQIIQLPSNAISLLHKMQKEKDPFVIEVGPFREELSWKENTPLMPPIFKPVF